MGPTPFYGAWAEKKPQKASFAMKQTNICRLSGDIKIKEWNKGITRKKLFQNTVVVFTQLAMQQKK